jgi:hypothetical protein
MTAPWFPDAACAPGRIPPDDVELFFPDRGGDTRPAKLVCHRCPVATQCLTDALDHGADLIGVYGGTSQRERQTILRNRRNGTTP